MHIAPRPCPPAPTAGPPHAPRLGVLATAVLLAACAPSGASDPVPVGLTPGAPTPDLAALGRAIGDRRVVLLGENGHGVGESTRLKVRLVEWLHREKGFEVVAVESGFWECVQAGERAATPRDMLHECLAYAFQHAEMLPLFEAVAAGGDRPLGVAGIDIQSQGYDSKARPAWSRAVLREADSGLAERVARQDSLLYLPPDLGGLGDGVDRWLVDSGAAVAARYDSAAAVTTGAAQWAFRMSAGLVDRLRLRAEAEAGGTGRPARYFEVRDEWMARAVRALADSIDGRRKVVVWLHNDHGRYGDWTSGELAVRSAGSYLREWLPGEVFTIGFFMARGQVADNGRTVHDVLPPVAGSVEAFLTGGGIARYLVLAGNRDATVRAFADSVRPYHRLGYQPDAMVPADEFDALVMIDSVGPPEYRIPAAP